MKLELMSYREYRDKKVENPWGEHLGSIQDLVLDTATGQVAYVVLAHGGFLGFGEKRFAVPVEAFKPTYNGHQVFLSVHRHTLDELPGFDKRSWPDAPDPELAKRVL
jgi:sporulation protein YlmC with PRC-barrel domain